MPEISPETARAALFEIEQTIDDTDDTALTDQVYDAHDELQAALESGVGRNISSDISTFITDDEVRLDSSQGGSIRMSRQEFRGVMAEFVRRGGLE